MTDRYGPRGVFAIVVPLQNANMQPEFELLRPDGISNQTYRFDISNHGSAPEAVVSAIPGTLGCWPDLILCGNSVEMADWTVEKQLTYRARLEEKANDVPVLTATDACQAALETLDARRRIDMVFITPMVLVRTKLLIIYSIVWPMSLFIQCLPSRCVQSAL